MEVIETERLQLRQWNENDFDSFARYYSDEANARYVGGKKDPEKAWRHLALQIGHWKLKGFGYWAVDEKDTTSLSDAPGYGSRLAGPSWNSAIGLSKSIKEKAMRWKHAGAASTLRATYLEPHH